ncbi:hypothetical protein L195_g011373 [Trifolium pratense]|uniref:Uncharacterized protein n=1 Tax=Trifolium pratense TaxID=57577 RepID=A0A2K3PHC1_TRIPR|nr:hypothetical protein L195_g011373 [Trifolium pratense]
MRGRERSATPKAHLGRPFRSSPSPEVKHKRGAESVDRGDSTEVSYRRPKALRKANRCHDRTEQNSRYQRRQRSYSNPGFLSLNDDQPWTNKYAHDHDHLARNQPRYSMDQQCNRQRSRSHHRRRSNSVFTNHDLRSDGRQRQSKASRRRHDSPN